MVFKNKLKVMTEILLLQTKVFLFILAILVIIADIFHIISVIALKKGKVITSMTSLTIFGVALSYVLTMLICGF